MPLPTPSQSVSHKQFHQCVNHKKKLSLRHPLPTFGSFSFFQASIWLGVDKVLQKLTKSYKNELRHLFQCIILIPRKCPHKTPFQHTVPPSPSRFLDLPTVLWSKQQAAAAEPIWWRPGKQTLKQLNGIIQTKEEEYHYDIQPNICTKTSRLVVEYLVKVCKIEKRGLESKLKKLIWMELAWIWITVFPQIVSTLE